MNATKRIIKGDYHILLKIKRFIDEFLPGSNVVKLGLITIYYDFISYFEIKNTKLLVKMQ